MDEVHIAFMDTLPKERKVRCRPIARHREPYVMQDRIQIGKNTPYFPLQ